MEQTFTTVLRLSPEEAKDLEEIQEYLRSRSGDARGVPRSRAALAAIRYYAWQLRRRRRREPREEG